ncbi:nucleoside deaminase [Streptomyces sp. ID01-9D]|uniref:nucleoside deaminase n=1 Tax=Streptomyces sp. ID01-9D TaxID=3028659 RepID=UPI0029C12182|nr:nucleoside deaminase [Streptomyces sp. ID01-9D]MDX5576536.1 nucleoside deaminase [Streptomyces sp. ID01-9D]MDX5576541.1 nucleoside deaminase [Streptomyces sp. ID01-9D]
MRDERDDEDFGQAWDAAPEAVRRSLGLAYEAWEAGGLAVGSVLVDAAGAVLAEGRNYAYDTGPGNGPLRGTPLAHAELNALGSARTEWDLGATTLWSTQEPCSMCSAAASFTGVGAVRYLAPDPWALATGNQGSSWGTCATGGGWLVAANVMFLKSVSEVAEGGEEPATLVRNRLLEPETAHLHDGLPPGLPAFPSVRAWLSEVWPRMVEAAAARRLRTGG